MTSNMMHATVQQYVTVLICSLGTYMYTMQYTKSVNPAPQMVSVLQSIILGLQNDF